MVSAVSLIGTAFAVGGSYFAVDSLRDILIAKTINTSYATRIAIASAAAFAGLMVISKDSASKASKQTKDRLGKQLLSAEGDDPNYMVKSDIHKIAESGIKMNVLMDEFPEADLPVWWKSKISVTASQADDLADNLGYVLAEPDAFDAEELTFHDWSDQEMMTHGKDDSFEDWVEHEIDSHGNLKLRDWADDEEESHIQRYGADTKVRRHSLDRFTKQRKPSGDSFRRKGRRSALRSMMAAEDNTVYMIETEYHSWDNWQNDCIAYDSFGPYATERAAKRALKEMMEDAAEQWTHHSSLEDPETGEPMFTFGLDRDEYGNVEIKPSGMSLSDFAQKHTKTEHKGGRDFDGMTYSGVVVAKNMLDDEEDYCDECGEEWPDDCECESYEADSDDDDDDTRPIPDREPRRGAPDLWFAEIYEAECASCDTTHGFDFMCAICGVCLDCDPCTHDSKARGPFTDRDAESFNECGLKGRDCHACRGCGRCKNCTIIDGYSISSGDMYCVDCSKYRGSKESVAIGTKFTCDCGAHCRVDADTEIAYGPGGYDLRCGRTDDCRGDEKVLGAEVFEAFSISDRPVSVKFGPGTSGNAKMKATFTDASGDTKTTQFGYKGMSDFTKHKDEGRRSSYLARHGSKGQNQNWKDPTTAGALSRYVLWEKTSLPAAKSAFKKRFNLRAEDLDTEDSYVGYQESPFITETDRMAAWVYEPVYSDEDAL